MMRAGGRALAWLVACVLAAGIAGAAPAGATVEVLRVAEAALGDKLYPVAERALTGWLQEQAVTAATADVSAVVEVLLRVRYAQGDTTALIETLDPADPWIARCGDAPFLGYWRAWVAFASNRLEEARAILGGLALSPGDPYLPYAHRLEIRIQLRDGQCQDALPAIRAFHQQYPDHVETPLNLLDWGRCLVAVGAPDPAGVVLRELAERFPGTPQAPEAAYQLGRLAVATGDREQAREWFARVVTNAAAGDWGAEAAYELAALCLRDGERTNAVAYLEQGIAAARDPQVRVRGQFRLGAQWLAQGNLDAARAMLKTAIASIPSHPEAESMQLRLAETLAAAGRNEEAIEEFQVYLEAYAGSPNEARALQKKGDALMRAGRPAEAAATYQRAAGVSLHAEERLECAILVADALQADGRFRAAHDAYAQASQTEGLGPERRARLLYRMAECLRGAGDPAGAEGLFLRVATNWPDLAIARDAWLGAAGMQVEAGRLAVAVQTFDAILKVHTNGPVFEQALAGRGLTSFKLQQYERARRDFNAVRRLTAGPAAEQAEYMAGLCSYWLGEEATAYATATNFVAAYTNSEWLPDVYFWLGNYQFNRGEYAGAASNLLASVDLAPTNARAPTALLWASLGFLRQRDYSQALEQATRLVRQYPDTALLADARFVQAEALRETASFNDAVLILDDLIGRTPGHRLGALALLRKGDCRFTMGATAVGRFEEALKSYRAALEHPALQPGQALYAEYRIGRCLEKLGRVTEAIDHLYTRVIARYMDEHGRGEWHTAEDREWFSRSVFVLADLLEARRDYGAALEMLQKVVLVDAPDADVARQRIEAIRRTRWTELH